MRFFISILFFYFSFIIAAAQEHKGLEYVKEKAVNSGKGNPDLKKTSVGIIAGTVVDNETSVPIEYANIVLCRTKDSSMVTGSITNKKGHFIIDKVPFGMFYLKVQFIGYSAQIITGIKITPDKTDYNTGIIKFKPSTTRLGEVTVASEKKLVEYQLDKKVINVEKNIAATGGTAADVMRDVPSVTIDADGNINLRGNSNFTVLIDGRPSPFSGMTKAEIFEQIPASSIETIEIITNPSARYQAEGMTGIVNIKLKKKISQGLNGVATLNAGTGTIIPGSEKLNGSVNMNYNMGAVNLFGSLDIGNRKNQGWGRFTRIDNSYQSDTTVNYNQWSKSSRESFSASAKMGADVILNQKNSITGSVLYNSKNGIHHDGDYNFSSMNNVGNSYFINSERDSDFGNSIDYALFYKKSFEEKERQLTYDVSLNTYNGGSRNDVSTQYYLPDTITFLNSTPTRENVSSLYKTYNLSAQADYVHPLDSSARFELGYKYQNRNIDQDYINNYFSYTSADWKLNEDFSNHFIYNEQVYAVYGIFSKMYKSFTFQVGTRAEYTQTYADQKTSDEVYKTNYSGLFPSAHLTKKLNENNDLQISYSRRINRPETESVNPFINRMSPIAYRIGNPYLKPEYVNSVELGHSFTFGKKNSVNSSVFYKQFKDVMKRFTYIDSITHITWTSFRNFASSESYGMEMQIDIQLLKWWKITGSGSFFRSIIYGDEVSNTSTVDNYSWNSRMSSSMKFGNKLDLQISGNYRGAMITPQGQMNPGYSVDIAAKKEIWNERATVSLRVSDIFNTQKFDVQQSGSGFSVHMIRKRESQVLFIGFSYKINEGIKQKNRKRQQEGGGTEDREMY